MTTPRVQLEVRAERLKLLKMTLANDDFLPREFVATY